VDVDERETRLANAMADYHRRRALGEAPDPDEYRAALGQDFGDFREILEASATLQEAVEPFTAPTLPRRFGRYTLTRRLGQGAMGVVFEALDEQLGRKVAIKVLRTGFDLDGSAFERFRREARACSQVTHPSIVTVHDAGAHDGRLYYTMDVAPGASLAARIRAGDLPPLAALLEGFARVADALHALHTHGTDPIVHRDVKPSNIIVQDDGHMVLADFGLARTAASESLTRTGDALGTPLYMSPEQAFGRRGDIDARSDVYGLGATIYEAVTGRPPFAGQDLADLMRRIDRDRPVSPRECAPDVPERLASVVLKALEKRREDRYPTAAAMAADLRLVAAGQRPRGSPVRRWRRAARWTLGRAPALALLLATLLGGAWLWTHRDGSVVFQIGIGRGWVVRLADGREVSAADVLALPPGDHQAEVVVPPGYEQDFHDVEPSRFHVSPGATAIVPLAVRPRTERGDALVLERAVDLPRLALPSARRRGTGRDVAWPRGRVRPEDLDEWAVALTIDDLGRGRTVRFETGDGVRLGDFPFTPDAAIHSAPMPAEVRERLRVGDRIRVSVVAEKGREIAHARFQVVDEPAVGERIRSALGRVGTDDAAVRAAVEARLLLAADLPGPALRAALSVDARERTLTAWGVLAAAADVLVVESAELHQLAAEVLEARKEAEPELFGRLFVEDPP
jgi:serine/threonine protein kinase